MPESNPTETVGYKLGEISATLKGLEKSQNKLIDAVQDWREKTDARLDALEHDQTKRRVAVGLVSAGVSGAMGLIAWLAGLFK